MEIGKLHDIITYMVPYWEVNNTKKKLLDWVENDLLKGKRVSRETLDDIRKERVWTPQKRSQD